MNHGFAGAAGTVAPFPATLPDGPFFIALRKDATTFYALTRRDAHLLDAKGILAPGFRSRLPTGSLIDSATLAKDGTLFVAGRFTIAGQLATLVKLRPDGLLDTSFSGPITANSASPLFDPGISAIASDGSGGCYIGGAFDRVNNTAAAGLGHVSASGTFTALPRASAGGAPSTPLFLAVQGGTVFVVETKTVYRADRSGATALPAPGRGWDTIKCAAFDPEHGLAVAGLTLNSDGVRCYVYSPEGQPRSGFERTLFLNGPAALAWDNGGRLLASSAQVELAAGERRRDAYGVKRLLADGSLDPAWSLLAEFDGLQPAMVHLQDRIVIGGAFSRVGPIECRNGAVAMKTDATQASPRNLSTRGVVGANSHLVIGFVVTGEFTTDVLIRASSMSLRQFGVPQTVSTTRFTLFRGQETIVDVPPGSGAPGAPYVEPSIITRATNQVGAFLLVSRGLNEAQELMTLLPGAYTIVIGGAAGETGDVLGEIFFL